MEGTNSVMFFSVLINENIIQIDHIHTTENKITEHIGLLYREKTFILYIRITVFLIYLSG